MKEAALKHLTEILRETYEGGLPGQGTEYLDHESGIRATLSKLTPEAASARPADRTSIAAHVRHMEFHLRTVAEWIQGDHSKRDWKGSFEPQAVDAAGWTALQQQLERDRAELLRVMRDLSEEKFVEEGLGFGAVAHLAYHLGAIRQLTRGSDGAGG